MKIKITRHRGWTPHFFGLRTLALLVSVNGIFRKLFCRHYVCIPRLLSRISIKILYYQIIFFDTIFISFTIKTTLQTNNYIKYVIINIIYLVVGRWVSKATYIVTLSSKKINSDFCKHFLLALHFELNLLNFFKPP